MKFNREQITKAAEILEGANVMVLNRDFDDFQNAIITALNTFSFIKELIEENEKLNKLLEHCEDDGEYWEGKYNNAVADTVRKMQELTKVNLDKYGNKLDGYSIVDQTAKEMLEENK